MREEYQQEAKPFVTYLAEEIGLEGPSERLEKSLCFSDLVQKLLALVKQVALLV